MFIRKLYLVLLPLLYFGCKQNNNNSLKNYPFNASILDTCFKTKMLNFDIDSLRSIIQIKDSLEGGYEMSFLHGEFVKEFEMNTINLNLNELIDSSTFGNNKLIDEIGQIQEIVYFSFTKNGEYRSREDFILVNTDSAQLTIFYNDFNDGKIAFNILRKESIRNISTKFSEVKFRFKRHDDFYDGSLTGMYYSCVNDKLIINYSVAPTTKMQKQIESIFNPSIKHGN